MFICLSCREKTQLSEEIRTKQDVILQRQSEVEALQSYVENTSQQREGLEKERFGLFPVFDHTH